jgi:hypothetical protein
MRAASLCAVCASPAPTDWTDQHPWLCSVACWRSYLNLPEPQPQAPPQTPLCHESVTMTCPLCQRSFTPAGRQKYCSDACKAAAYRRRRDANRPPIITIPRTQPRRPITIYECDNCGQRALGEQRCDDCHTFMRKIGLGGECPHCSEPVAVTELLDQGVNATD